MLDCCGPLLSIGVLYLIGMIQTMNASILYFKIYREIIGKVGTLTLSLLGLLLSNQHYHVTTSRQLESRAMVAW